MALMQASLKVAWNLEAELGEGPVWVNRDSALWFVDIKKRKIHRYDPANGEKRSWDAPEQVGFILPSERGGFIAGLQSGLSHFDDQRGTFELIVEVEPDLPDNRLNDGAVDPSGRLWFGTMDNNEKAKSGAFYCFADGQVKKTGIEDIAITNGPAISPDGRIIYFVDTLRGAIEAADIGEDGSLANRRAFVKIDPRNGYPDGPTVDSNGDLWISLYAGWEAQRFSSRGELSEQVRFPVANITKIAFGGNDLRTVFATTARQLLGTDAIAKQPQIGDLFEFRVDVPGVPCPLVRY